jgi:hypothetical protein
VAPQGAVVDLWVVGIVRYPTDLVPVVTDQDNLFINTSELYLTPAYWQRYGPDIANYRISLAVTLRHGQADLSRLRADLRRLYGNRAAVITEGLASDETTTAGTRRAIRLESAALAGFGLLAALAALLLVGQTLGRQILLEAAESPILRALGMTRGQLVGLALVRAAPVAVAGSVLAVAGAVELSPATPLGVARRAELDPGLAVDLPVLAVGAAGVMAGVLACAVLAGWRAGRAPAGGVGAAEPADSAERRPRVAGALAATGLPPTAVTGTRLALEPGRGRTAVPVRSALTAAAAAVCAMTLAVTFGASLLHLVGDPRAYGVTWDLQVGNFADSQGPEQAARKLASNPYVAAYRGGCPAWARSSRAGRCRCCRSAPARARLGRSWSRAASPPNPTRSHWAAPACVPLASASVTWWWSAASASSGCGSWAALWSTWATETPPSQRAKGRSHTSTFGVASAHPTPRTVRASSSSGSTRPATGAKPSSSCSATSPTPWSFHSSNPTHRPGARRLPPGLLAGLVALLALGTVTHALVTSVRRRGRDLAILKTLGFERIQVSQTVAWQATTFALLATLVGVPLGIAGGRWAWRLVADQLGVASGPVVSPASVLAIAAGALLAANLAAAGPGWAAARVQPAAVLRSE